MSMIIPTVSDCPAGHDFEKLPQWAKKWIREIKEDLAHTQEKLERTQQASNVTADGHDWFIINGPRNGEYEKEAPMPKVYHLWMLYADNPHRICSLGWGDKLLVARAKKEG